MHAEFMLYHNSGCLFMANKTKMCKCMHRALFQVVSRLMENLDYLEPAVALVLGFVGIKMVSSFFCDLFTSRCYVVLWFVYIKMVRSFLLEIAKQVCTHVTNPRAYHQHTQLSFFVYTCWCASVWWSPHSHVHARAHNLRQKYYVYTVQTAETAQQDMDYCICTSAYL